MTMQQVYPLTEQQKGLWFEYKLRPHANNYNCYSYHEIRGSLDEAKFFQALRELMKTFEPFRLQFREENEDVFQVISETPHAEVLFFKDLSDLKINEEDRIDQVKALLLEENSRPYNLNQDFPARITFIKISSQFFCFGISFHHIVGDAFSLDIYYQFLTDFYHQRQDLAEQYQGISTKEYFDTLSREDIYSDQAKRKSIAYWKEELKGRDLQIPFSKIQRDSHEDYHTKKMLFHFDQETFAKIKRLYIKLNTTPFRFFSACFGALIYRYWNYRSIVMGYPVGLRPKSFQNSPGFYVSMFPLRLDLEKEVSIDELASQITYQRRQDKEYQNIVFSELAPALRTEDKNLDLNFNVVVGSTLLSYNLPLSGLEVTNLAVCTGGDPRTDLSLLADFTSSNLSCELKYDPALFSENFIKGFILHFKSFVNLALENPTEKISEICFLSAEEKQQLLVEWNDTQRDYPCDKTIHQLFEEQVESSPDHTAVVFEDMSLTYGELNTKANQIAHYLRDKGVKPDTLVAIACERSLDMIVGILGILKAGGAYVPLDPSYPLERLAYMMHDTKAPVLLTQAHLIDHLPQTDAHVVLLDQSALVKEYPIANPMRTAQSHHLAYVIYTSGSTGKPKGVMIEHQSICDRLFWWQEYVPLSSKDRYLHQFSFSFDGAVASLWWPLLSGSVVIIPTSQGLSDGEYLIKLIAYHKITALFSTTSLMNFILNQKDIQELDHIRTLILGGEAFPKDVLEQAQKLKDCRIYNFCGPTETTILATSYEATHQKCVTTSVPIGAPVANTQVYILDGSLHPVPVGVVGELYIGGVGLARGYLNQPDLTAERFIENPFATEADKKEGKNFRLYKTGDLCRWLEGGNIDYVGRIDDQVKLRGFRIELGEIESVLKQHPEIKDSVVILREDTPDDKRLVAYIIVKQDSIDMDAIISFLKDKLPEYMIPLAFVTLDRFPLTPNGKIDKKALPKPDYQRDEKKYVAPRNDFERQICQIWAEILGLPEHIIGINDNFFTLGGNSILSTRVVSCINNLLKSDIKLVDLYTAPTIDLLSFKVIKSRNGYQPVIKLTAHNHNKPNMIMIHPAAAGVEVYVSLANKLSNYFCCYGIESYNLYHEKKIDNLHDLANYYWLHIDKIMKETNQDAYHLLGWSSGGQIALELATIIEQKINKRVNVYLLDTILAEDYLFSVRKQLKLEDIRESLTSQGYSEAYIEKVVSNLDTDARICLDKISFPLSTTKVFLFKAMLPHPQLSRKYYDDMLSTFEYNDVEKYVKNTSSLKVIKINDAHHLSIIEREKDIVDGILAA